MVEISLICTVYNEGESIRDLLDSIVEQTRIPDEAVFVDAGSEDQTQEIIEEYQEEHDWIRLIIDEGCNIAEGRNTAVENAENDYIVGTDGGCIVDEKWCEAMEKAFEEGYEALSGLFQPRHENIFEYVQGQLRAHYVRPENVPNNWPPSSRSIGFTRQVWEEAGGYPEHLYTGEDSKFNSNVRRAGYEWNVVREAMVYWEMRPTWKSYWKQFRQYGEGDARAGNLFDYPGKVFGVSKVFLRISTTALALSGLILSVWNLLFLLFLPAGFAPQYASKLSALKQCLDEEGIKTVPYWMVLIPFASVAHLYGYCKEKLRLLNK
ncbi:glycosyltransferase [Nanohaloarchaea archaeon H01]|nr:glycosyltransferase [Nanohaloarchaea archaeon H01]